MTSVGNEADLTWTWMTTGLPEHLVGPGEKRWGDGQAEHLGRLQVNDQLELGGLVHRELARLRPSEWSTDLYREDQARGPDGGSGAGVRGERHTRARHHVCGVDATLAAGECRTIP